MKLTFRWVIVGIVALFALTGLLALFGVSLPSLLSSLFEGAFADKFALHRTIVKSSPLILVALGLSVAWRAGMFNIGGEGQLLVGVLMGATLYSLSPHLPVPQIALLFICTAGGASYAWIAAILRVRRGVNVVIGTILLNFVAIQAVSFGVRGPIQEPSRSIPQTQTLADSVMFARPDPQTDLHWGVAIAPLAAILLYVWMFHTPSGFRLRLSGSNPRAARAALVSSDHSRVTAMLVSGGLCGLAGGIEYVGVSGYLYDGFSPGWGFLGIPVALLGGLHPIGIIVSGVLFGALVSGTKHMEAFGGVDSSLVFAIQGVVLLASVAMQAWRSPEKPEAAK